MFNSIRFAVNRESVTQISSFELLSQGLTRACLILPNNKFNNMINTNEIKYLICATLCVKNLIIYIISFSYNEMRNKLRNEII